MQHVKRDGILNTPQTFEFSLVYYYLVAGISLLVAVFLFLPRVSVG